MHIDSLFSQNTPLAQNTRRMVSTLSTPLVDRWLFGWGGPRADDCPGSYLDPLGSNMVAIPRVCGKYLWVWNFNEFYIFFIVDLFSKLELEASSSQSLWIQHDSTTDVFQRVPYTHITSAVM